MAQDWLDDNLKKFIAQHVTSVEQLEILLLLSENPAHPWLVEDVFKVIQSNPDSIRRRLRQMQDSGILQADEHGGFRYNPVDEAIAAGVTALRTAYRQSHVKVIELIFSDSMQQARQFANSFRIRRDP